MPPLESGLGAGCLLPAQALLEAVGAAPELEDVAAMGEAVQESRREVGVPDYGKELSQRYTWERTAERYEDVYLHCVR